MYVDAVNPWGEFFWEAKSHGECASLYGEKAFPATGVTLLRKSKKKRDRKTRIIPITTFHRLIAHTRRPLSFFFVALLVSREPPFARAAFAIQTGDVAAWRAREARDERGERGPKKRGNGGNTSALASLRVALGSFIIGIFRVRRGRHHTRPRAPPPPHAVHHVPHRRADDRRRGVHHRVCVHRRGRGA